MVNLTPSEFETAHLKFTITEGKSEKLSFLKLLVRQDLRSPIPDGEHEVLIYNNKSANSNDTSYLELASCQCRTCNTSGGDERVLVDLNNYLPKGVPFSEKKGNHKEKDKRWIKTKQLLIVSTRLASTTYVFNKELNALLYYEYTYMIFVYRESDLPLKKYFMAHLTLFQFQFSL